MQLRFNAALEYWHTVDQLDGVTPDIWQLRYTDGLARRSLPALLALVHPKVAPVSIESRKKCVGPRLFSVIKPHAVRCSSSVIWGYDCPLTSSTHHIDHFWPYSLGGRSVVENGLWLCDIHNRAKSDDVHFFSWENEQIPDWLKFILARFRVHIEN